jgi:predicted ATPase
MSDTIKKLTIEGFKSIRKLEDFELRSLNVLIGANGAGKSNFVGFFRLLHELIEQRLQVALQTTEGGADACLFMGPKITERFVAKLSFGSNGYRHRKLLQLHLFRVRASRGQTRDLKDGPGPEGALNDAPYCVYKAISSWVVYHFHDTSLTAGMRRQKPINDNEVLRPDA